MKKTKLLILFILLSHIGWTQAISGTWEGVLSIQGQHLRIVFHIQETEEGYSALMDSPDQGAKGIPVTETSYEQRHLTMNIASAGIVYEALLQNDSLIGQFKQSGMSFTLNLTKGNGYSEVQAVKRPQEPLPPYPYTTEEIQIVNTKAGVSLAGTLTLPKGKGPFPAVILITGSGPQNRDEEIFKHKPFLVIADYLTRNGIAVLRYDDRGCYQSTGNFNSATTEDLASDAEAVLTYLKSRKEITKVGLAGHSEGGIIAPVAASANPQVDFIISLAGTGIPGDKLLLMQQAAISKAMGMSEQDMQTNRELNTRIFEIFSHTTDSTHLRDDISLALTQWLEESQTALPEGMRKEDFIEMQIQQITTPWMAYFIRFNPAPAWEKVHCPVLALNGEKDLQVPYKENLAAIEAALKKGGNRKITLKSYPNLNHLFQECTSGLPTEYETIEQTFSPVVLKDMVKWIKKQK